LRLAIEDAQYDGDGGVFRAGQVHHVGQAAVRLSNAEQALPAHIWLDPD
jgi:hypothetical protein